MLNTSVPDWQILCVSTIIYIIGWQSDKKLCSDNRNYKEKLFSNLLDTFMAIAINWIALGEGGASEKLII